MGGTDFASEGFGDIDLGLGDWGKFFEDNALSIGEGVGDWFSGIDWSGIFGEIGGAFGDVGDWFGDGGDFFGDLIGDISFASAPPEQPTPIVMNVQTKDANSFNQSSGQIVSALSAAVSQASRSS